MIAGCSIRNLRKFSCPINLSYSSSSETGESLDLMAALMSLKSGPRPLKILMINAETCTGASAIDNSLAIDLTSVKYSEMDLPPLESLESLSWRLYIRDCDLFANWLESRSQASRAVEASPTIGAID